MAASARVDRVVTIAAVSTSSPLGPVQVSHRPAKASGAPDFARTTCGHMRTRGEKPVVKAISRKKAAKARMALRNAGLSSADSPRALISSDKVAGMVYPSRNEAPAHERESTLAVGEPHSRNRLGRRHVVARRKIRPLAVAEQRPDRVRRRGDDIASAHWDNDIRAELGSLGFATPAERNRPLTSDSSESGSYLRDPF